MRVLTAEQMQNVDAETIERVVPGIELMERAGRGAADVIRERFGTAHAAVFVGSGNNGGDGLVVARLLIQAGWSCSIHLLKPGPSCTPDTATNYARLAGLPRLWEFDATRPDWETQAAGDLARSAVVVDSIFGTGFSGVPRDEAAGMIRVINQIHSTRRVPVVSIDIPSGVNATTGEAAGDVVRADLTLTIGTAKTGLLFHPGRSLAGELDVIDIGFPPDIVEKHSQGLFLLDRRATAARLPARAPDMHKYRAGVALVVAGSERYRGAALLAAEAALRGGCGMVYLAVPESMSHGVPMSIREAIVVALPQTHQGTISGKARHVLAPYLEKADAVAVGPGLDPNPETDAFVRQLVVECPKPVVVDAGGLTAFEGHADELAEAKSPVILTPHDGEFARLTGERIPTAPLERIGYASRAARKLGVTLVHKGSPTLIASWQGDVWINGSGTSALAKGGTGDVLTGLAVSFLAQTAAVSPPGDAQALDAACLACWLHGRAGELVAQERGERGVIASDLLVASGRAMVELEAR